MDLCISKPENAEEGIIYSLPSNIDRNNEKINGHFCVTREKILIYLDGKITDEYVISDFAEFNCRQMIGASMAQGETKDGETVFFCAFIS